VTLGLNNSLKIIIEVPPQRRLQTRTVLEFEYLGKFEDIILQFIYFFDGKAEDINLVKSLLNRKKM
jgi:hypothetical protein